MEAVGHLVRQVSSLSSHNVGFLWHESPRGGMCMRRPRFEYKKQLIVDLSPRYLNLNNLNSLFYTMRTNEISLIQSNPSIAA